MRLFYDSVTFSDYMNISIDAIVSNLQISQFDSFLCETSQGPFEKFVHPDGIVNYSRIRYGFFFVSVKRDESSYSQIVSCYSSENRRRAFIENKGESIGECNGKNELRID